MKVMKTPKSLDLSITHKCNLRCSYCSHFSSPAETDHDLPAEEWLRFFEEMGRCAVMDVTLSGGEVFVRKDFGKLVDGIIRNQMRFAVLTNGTLITDEKAAYIASTGRCNYVQVSLDGSAAEVHDSQRGEGNFSKAVQGIRTLQKHKLPVTVRVTIHRHNVNDLEKVSKLLLEDFGLPGFSTNAASHMGLCRENADNIQLSVGDHTLAMETLLRLNKKYGDRISANAGPLANADMWGKMEKARREGREMPGKGYLKACGGVLSKMDIRADGTMTPCILMSHIELGRINKDDLKSVWQDHPELIRLRERRKIALNDIEYCEGCEYIPYCTGNCPALAHTIMGKDDVPSPDACLKRFLEQGGKLPDERV